ncbi:plasmid pRiA4b ORF-3 family protein [Nocardioides sp.]|uniref:plasmid pRiA4b ORF-3 family protein n=1 Tax=Nocardioides sp. TaxID=35761 RepID=UPI002734F927|nr:plasmid pRiA4b ORF-3 family protein [Nocardioides sp.]MDP3889761.1 plasmid pRiA4b ORF-3 family protein [Nocardioides sp.]
MTKPSDVDHLVKQLAAGVSPAEGRALLEGLLSGQVSSIFEKLSGRQEPTVGPVPTEVRRFRVRLDLHGAKPPVWRRLELRGDLMLPRLHNVIQAAMGWHDGHLHRFRTGRDHRAPYFVTAFDVEEGEDGVLEDDVRLDQLVAAKGDELWYEYDFGDGWEHRLVVEKVLDEPPVTARCTAGRMACPPEDCGGIGGYDELAAWVRSDYDDALLPQGFENAAHGREWLPLEWHPDHFDVDEVNATLARATAEPVAVTEELAEIADRLDQRGGHLLREVLGRPLSHVPTDISDAEAARLTETYRIFLDVIDDGVKLTGAGYLPPDDVERFAELSGIAGWWIGKANREDYTPPVANLRDSARALGLVTVRKGHLTATTAGLRCRLDPMALWKHIVGRLPLGSKDFDRHAGWMALAVVGSGVPAEEWHGEVSELLSALGWRIGRVDYAPPPAHSPTLVVLEHLAGTARVSRLTGIDLAVAATARAAIQRS